MNSGRYWSSTLEKRISRRRSIQLAGAGAAGFALLTACGGEKATTTNQSGIVSSIEDTSKRAQRGGTYKWYLVEEPPHFDPMLTSAPASFVKDNVYAQLVVDKPGYMGPQEFREISPVIAESWEWTPDLLQLTMKVRQGVKWHNIAPVNGRELNVQDLLSSWERFLRVGTQRAAYANSISPEAPIVSLTSPDSKTIVWKLAYPVSFLLNMFANTNGGHFVTVPKEAVDGTYDIRHDVIGCGPFSLAGYKPSIGLTFKRHPEFWDKSVPFIEQIEAPFVPEYATRLSQFKTGSIYTQERGLQSTDVFATKQDVPEINVYQVPMPSIFIGKGTSMGWLPAGKAPFGDERVRQALSMSYDRDLWLDVFGNVSKFRAQGLPVDTQWFTAMGGGSSWWLDPKGKDFGPNAKYYQHDVAEAKKLMTAAGYGNGIDVISRWAANFGDKEAEVLDGMANEIGIRTTRQFLDVGVEYPKFRDGEGKWENGWAHLSGGGSLASEPVAQFTGRYTKAGGASFAGFDVNGRGDGSGDPSVEAMIKKANLELDLSRRQAIVYDIQRYLGKTQYVVVLPGQFSTLNLAWPAVRNFLVQQGGSWTANSTRWIDPTQAPIKRP